MAGSQCGPSLVRKEPIATVTYPGLSKIPAAYLCAGMLIQCAVLSPTMIPDVHSHVAPQVPVEAVVTAPEVQRTKQDFRNDVLRDI
jgi:hypothetical protein